MLKEGFMFKRLLNLSFFVLITFLAWLLNFYYPHVTLNKLFWTFLAFAFSYLVFRVILQEVLSRPISDEETKYKFRKTVSILYWVVFGVLFLRIWVVNPQALLVAYGLIAAGVAVALQDFFKNFVGGITLFVKGMYRVGDRIEVNGEFGDVIDVGLMYTTVMELREWVGGDQATGRVCTLPNGFVLSHVVNNYTRDHNFIWDEIFLPITYNSDWKKAKTLITGIVEKKTGEFSKQAEREITKLKQKFLVSKREVKPNIFFELTDNWIGLHIRYVTDAKSRRLVHNELTQLILEAVQKSKNVKIASQTLDIVGFKKK